MDETQTPSHTPTDTNEPAKIAPPSQPAPRDIEALTRENAKLREDIRKAAEARDQAREKARQEMGAQVDAVLEEVQNIKAAALAANMRAVDALAVQAVPEPLRPVASTLLAGLRAQDPTLAVTANADVDALASTTAAKLTELLSKAGTVTQAPGLPTPNAPKSGAIDWRNIKDPAELRKTIRDL